MEINSLRISIVICTYNRAKFIGDALKSLSNQTLNPENFEILIINNNSSDNTQTIVDEFISNHKHLDISSHFEVQQGLSYARNRGLKEAKYQIITYIDDDAYAKNDFAEIIYSTLNENPNIQGLGGKVIPQYEVQEPLWMNKYLLGIVTGIDYGPQRRKFMSNNFPVGCNMTYRKDILLEAGGFNNNLKWRADDKYIYYEVKKISDEVYYIPELEVRHTIDAQRTTDKNFINITTKFGSAESIRVQDEGFVPYLKKLVEFIYKLAGSFVLMILYTFRGQYIKGKYIFWYRWIATKAFLSPDRT